MTLAPPIEEAGATVHNLTGRRGRIANVRTVLAAIRALAPDIVHTTLFESDVAGRTAARLAGVPVSSSLVNDSYGPSHFRESGPFKIHAAQALDRHTARLATRFHAISEVVADNVGARLGISREVVDVIPRGRDPRRFPFRSDSARLSARASLGIRPDAPVILAVGRLEPQKGLHHLLDAVALLAHCYPDLAVLIAGREGRSSADVRSQARRTEVDVRFLGNRSDIPDLLASADVLCFPSEREGFGGVLIEALAVGCPIVASDIPTTREVLRGAPSAKILNVADSALLAEVLKRELTTSRDNEAARLRAAIGRRVFEERFAIDCVALRMADFFSVVSAGR